MMQTDPKQFVASPHERTGPRHDFQTRFQQRYVTMIPTDRKPRWHDSNRPETIWA